MANKPEAPPAYHPGGQPSQSPMPPQLEQPQAAYQGYQNNAGYQQGPPPNGYYSQGPPPPGGYYQNQGMYPQQYPPQQYPPGQYPPQGGYYQQQQPGGYYQQDRGNVVSDLGGFRDSRGRSVLPD